MRKFLFRKKTIILGFYTIILVSLPLGECVDEVADSQENYQGYRYDIHFLQCRTSAVIYSLNDEGEITNNEIFAFIVGLFFKLSSRKVLLIIRKGNRNC